MRIIKLFLLLFALPLQAAETIEVQALMPGLVVLVIDGERVTLHTGDNADGVKLISSNTKSATLEVDGEKKEFKMGTTIGTSFKKRAFIIERVVADESGMFRGYGSINGQSVNYLIDTGATTIAMSAKEARKLGIQYRMEGKPTHANTASGIAKAWSIQLKTVRLGKLLERNVRGMVVDGDHPTEVLLGMSFLNRMKVEKEGKLMLITRKK